MVVPGSMAVRTASGNRTVITDSRDPITSRKCSVHGGACTPANWDHILVVRTHTRPTARLPELSSQPASSLVGTCVSSIGKRAANTLTAQVWGVPALAPHPQLRRAGMRRVTKKQVLEMAALIYINQKRGCSCCQQTKMMIRSKSKSITIFCSASFLRVSGSESRFRTMISINRGINIANCG